MIMTNLPSVSCTPCARTMKTLNRVSVRPLSVLQHLKCCKGNVSIIDIMLVLECVVYLDKLAQWCTAQWALNSSG